jgi:hypothetical protein
MNCKNYGSITEKGYFIRLLFFNATRDFRVMRTHVTRHRHCFLTSSYKVKKKSKGIPRQAEVAVGVPGR